MSERAGQDGDPRLLEACLERMSVGDDIASVLAACPDPALADIMRPLLEIAAVIGLDGARADRPSASFKADLSARIAAAPAPSSLNAFEATAEQTAQPSMPGISITDEGSPTSQLVSALDSWLTAREVARPAGASFDAMPDETDELAPLLDLATTLSRDGARAHGPSAQFRTELARRLAEAPAPRSVRDDWRAPSSFFRRLWHSTAFMATGAATVILCLGAGVTYASASALPGELLYPVKRSVESVRLAVASDGGAMDLRLDFAERRLAEAIGSPEVSGEVLAEFSYQISAALAIVDASIAAGAPRELVAAPLVDWLIAARRELIVSQAGLPPMAWRGARALLDEAIVALSGGGVLTGHAVWRLSEPSAVLALREAPTHPWAWERLRAGRPIVIVPPLPSPLDSVPSSTLATVSGVSASLASSIAASAPPSAPLYTESRNSTPGGMPSARLTGGQPARAPTAARLPTAMPTATPAPPIPTEPPTVAPPTAIPPTELPPPPTIPPTATPRIDLPLPARLEVYCDPETVESAGSTMCHVTLPAPAMPGEVQWSASFGRIDVPDSDVPTEAIFTDNTGMSGVTKLIVTITVSFTPSDGPSSTGTTEVFIVPRLGGEDG